MVELKAVCFLNKESQEISIPVKFFAGSEQGGLYKGLVPWLRRFQKDGLGRKEISEILGMPYMSLHYRISKLVQVGLLEPFPRQRCGPMVGKVRRGIAQLLEDILVASPDQQIKLTDIASQFAVSRGRARQIYNEIAAKQPVPALKNTRRKREVEDFAVFDAQVGRLLEDGLNTRLIGKKLEVSNNLVVQARCRIRQRRNAQIVEFMAIGKGNKDIGEALGLSESYVRAILGKEVKSGSVKRFCGRRNSGEIKTFDENVEALSRILKMIVTSLGRSN